jgi:hypothetical protein
MKTILMLSFPVLFTVDYILSFIYIKISSKNLSDDLVYEKIQTNDLIAMKKDTPKSLYNKKYLMFWGIQIIIYILFFMYEDSIDIRILELLSGYYSGVFLFAISNMMQHILINNLKIKNPEVSQGKLTLSKVYSLNSQIYNALGNLFVVAIILLITRSYYLIGIAAWLIASVIKLRIKSVKLK